MPRTLLSAGLLAIFVAGAVAPLAAGVPVSVPNSCRYSFDLAWHDQPIVVDLAADPNPVAPAGTFSATGGVRLEMPGWLTGLGAGLGFLTPGANRIPARASVALAAAGGAPATQVLHADVEFVTTVQGGGGTPLTVTVPLAPTAWTAPAGGAVALRQAGPGLLPKTPAGTTPFGSVHVEGTLGPLAFSLDCQPGSSKPGGSGPIPQEAPAALTVGVGAPAPPAATVETAPGVAVLSRALRLRNGAVRVAVRCVAATPCAGVATLRSRARLRLGATRAVLALGRAPVALEPGGATTLVLRPAPRVLGLLGRRTTLPVRVVVAPASGEAASRALVLRLREAPGSRRGRGP